MGGETRLLMAGCIILVVIVNAFMILSIVFPATVGQNASFQQKSPAKTFPNDTTTEATMIATQAPSTTPAPIVVSLAPTPVPTRTGPASYVTVEPKVVEAPEKLHDLSTDIPRRDFSSYVTIYSLNKKEVSQNLPYVSYNLATPPLVIDFDVVPVNITDVKEIRYKIIATEYNVVLTINRPYENTWFKIIVRDKETGEIVAEDGYGKTYALQSPRQLILYKGGNYQFEFTGQYAYVDLSMKVKREGNFR